MNIMNSISFFKYGLFRVYEKLHKRQFHKLIVTDPPYGIGFNGVTSDTSWDNIDYESFITMFLTESKRILADDGTLWMCCGRTQIPTVFKVIEKVGLHCNLDNWLTYARQKGLQQ